MKKLIIPILLLSTIISCNKKDDADESEQLVKENNEVITLAYQHTLKPLVFEYTSTGCPGCGSWGKPTFYNLINEFNDQIVPIAVHIKYGDPMITPTSEAIAANRYGQFYTPQIWINDTNGVQLIGGSINSSASINYMRQLITQYSSPDFISIDGKSYSNDDLGIKVKVGIKLNKTTTDDLYLSCYLMENGLVYNQSSSPSNPTTHNHVIRKTAETTWGKQAIFDNGSFEFEHTFEGEKFNPNKYIALVLWKKQGSRFVAVGGHMFN